VLPEARADFQGCYGTAVIFALDEKNASRITSLKMRIFLVLRVFRMYWNFKFFKVKS